MKIFADRYAARMTRGGNIPAVERLPYFPEKSQALLAEFERLILVEARQPVSFFGYPGLRSSLAPEACVFDVLASEDQDGAGALEWLAGELGAPPSSAAPGPQRPTLPTGELLTDSPLSDEPLERFCPTAPSCPMKQFRPARPSGRTFPR